MARKYRSRFECTENDLTQLQVVLDKRFSSTVEYTVLRVYPSGAEEALSGGHFEIGGEQFPDEDAARYAAIRYAEKISAIVGLSGQLVVRRTASSTVWDQP